MSEKAINKYPDDLKEDFLKLKPGYVSINDAYLGQNTLDDIFDGIRIYLEKHKQAPITTDIVYFAKAMKNKIFHGKRSG